MTRQSPPRAVAEAVVAERFPAAVAAFLGGTVLGPLRTPLSDLDVVVIVPEGTQGGRETTRADGWTVELFVMTPSAYGRIVAREVAARRSPLLDMVGGGVVLAGGTGAETTAADARARLAAGPPPATAAELDDLRYGVSDLLDDLRGAADPAEAAFVAVRLVDAVGRLALVCEGAWLGTGKWLGRRLWDLDPALHAELVAGLRAAAAGDGGPLAEVAAGVLDRVGGPLLAGYRVAGEPAFPYEVAPQLDVRRGVAAVDFYREAFGAVELLRVGGDEAEPSVVAQLSVGGATFWAADEAPAYGHASPEGLGATTARLLLVVPNPAELVDRAVSLGAEEIDPVAERYGYLMGMIRDPFGHLWEIGYPLSMP